MRATWVSLAALGAWAVACTNPDGAFLQIRAPEGATTVELFMGHDVVANQASCTNGSCFIGPPSTQAGNPVGQYYLGEGWTSVATTSIRAPLIGTRLSYRVTRGSDSTRTLPALLVVAYDGQGQPVAERVLRDVPLAGGGDIPVTLLAAAAIGAGSGERIQVWRRPGDAQLAQQSACAVVKHADGTVAFFVPTDDSDCDGAIPNTPHPECSAASEWNYCGITGAASGLSEATCIRSTDSQSCRFGGPPLCADSGPDCSSSIPSCVPTIAVGCLPPQVCQAATGCDLLQSLCLGPGLAAATTPKVSCPLQLETTGNGYCTDTINVGSAALLAGQACTGLFLITIPFAGTGSGSGVYADGITYSLGPPVGTPCNRVLTFAGSQTLPPQPTVVLLGVQTASMTKFVPLDIRATGSGACTPAPACALAPDTNFPCP